MLLVVVVAQGGQAAIKVVKSVGQVGRVFFLTLQDPQSKEQVVVQDLGQSQEGQAVRAAGATEVLAVPEHLHKGQQIQVAVVAGTGTVLPLH